ncbi:MAG TPA: amidase family protein [Kouleothrix sp.]|uniref:amidase family protein n=1 Tax=Kouleothrix sp. TaxID=2779161 RepID=UPI002C999E53|nr:amidase family protein [Kouleothrix sp.]HRC75995.1 amidase family protein [Kouleothrix sp.]
MTPEMIATDRVARQVATPTPADLTSMPATVLAALIARGEVSASEAVDAHIERIEQVNPQLNAVVLKRYDTARAEARAADTLRARGMALGPLHGLPVTVKETLDLAGFPSSFGIESRAETAAECDERHVARLRQAGAIVLGKTNMAQMLLFLESDNPVYGRTNNPWNPDRSSGGSSGGEAAMIAAGGSALGLGSDIGGSLRVPATFCGIASLKPTAGRCPDMGRFSVPLGQQAIVSQVGVLARTTDDVALGMKVIDNGSDIPLGDPASVDVSRLRVAYYTDDGRFAVAPAVARAVREAAASLRDRGAQVIEWTPPDIGATLDLVFQIFSADGGRYFNTALGRTKRDVRVATLALLGGRSHRTTATLSRLLAALGQRQLASVVRNFGYSDTAHYWECVEAQLAYRQRFADALDQAEGGPLDVILSPACALPAFTHGASQDLGTAGSYTVLYNALGYPAGVVPFTRVRLGEEVGRAPSRDRVEEVARRVEQGSAGLPVGVQVAARPWRDHVALAAMRAIEQAALARPDFPATPLV